MNNIGLHLRFENHIISIVRKALQLKLPIFQCFLIKQSNGKYILLSQSIIKEFYAARHQFSNLYLHGSYYINLTNPYYKQNLLKKELYMAKKLGFTHFVLHPGAVQGNQSREDAIDAIAKVLNKILKKENDIALVLENSAHGNKSIGGDLEELYLIRSKLDNPEKLKFCIDTAHAYVFGYDISDAKIQHEFINQIDKLLGFDSIALIHLNNTKELMGSKIDKHSIVNQGNIPIESVKSFINNEHFKYVPIILELPGVDEKDEIEALNLVRLWKK